MAADRVENRQGLTAMVSGWSVGAGSARRCQPWITDVVSDNTADLPWERPLSDFVAAARPATSALDRSRPLLAVPVIGTGGAGTPRPHGEICQGVLTTLRRLAAEHDVDLALVVKDGDLYSAAQAVRRRAEPTAWWSRLVVRPALREAADGLARLAVQGDLVLFLGAGVSRRAGVPGWTDLLGQLAEHAGMTVEEAAALIHSKLGNLEKAAVIDAYLAARDEGDPVSHRNALLEELTVVGQYSLAHGLLAGLPVREVATTNYDSLFEMASRAAGVSTAVLPYEAITDSERWVLKLHGSVGHDDLVLSRSDYLRNAQQSSALAGLVQALLITRHLWFVGYSLDDDSFHRIAFDVRQALRRRDRQGHPFGTALMVGLDPQLGSIWDRDVALADLGAGRAGADLLEEVIDYVACHATSSAPHLFNEGLVDVLTSEEQALRDALGDLARRVDLEMLDPGVRTPLAQLLAAYGYGYEEDEAAGQRISQPTLDEGRVSRLWETDG